MSYIDILILRHLSNRPAHGYELRKRVEAVTGFVLHNNSLYPALRRFEEAGAVVKTSHAQQGRPAKLVYELTDVGQDLLHEMLAELPAEQAGDDTEFLTRLGQFEFLTPAERLIVLDARDAALTERLGRLAGLLARSAGQTWSGLVTAELIVRAEQERGWLARLRQLAEDAGEAAEQEVAARSPATSCEGRCRQSEPAERSPALRSMTATAAAAPASRLGPVVQHALLAGLLLSMLDGNAG
jgi:DNA-binding PadR family transcriptional regulator